MSDFDNEVHYGVVLLEVLEDFSSEGIIDFPLAAMIYAWFCKLADDKKNHIKECESCE